MLGIIKKCHFKKNGLAKKFNINVEYFLKITCPLFLSK